MEAGSSNLGVETLRQKGGIASLQSRSTPAILQTSTESFEPTATSTISRISASSTSRLPTKHSRSFTEGQDNRGSIRRISKLLDAVLGSSLSTPSVESSNRTSMENVSIHDAASRSASPTPSVDYTLVSVPSIPTTPRSQFKHLPSSPARPSSPEHASCSSAFFSSPSKKVAYPNAVMGPLPSSNVGANRRLFPRLWTALSSPTRETTTRLKRKGKGRMLLNDDDPDYPLDGEEGELVDDEACFVDTPNVSGSLDILSNLPPEIGLYVLLFVDLQTILSCMRVCRYWNQLASDPLIWRPLFDAAGWEVNKDLVQRRLYGSKTTRMTRNNSLISAATSVRNEIDVALNRIRRGPQPPSTPPRNRSPYRQSIASTTTYPDTPSSPSSFLGTRIPEGSLAPLALDWYTLYKIRHELDRRMYGSSSGLASSMEEGAAAHSPPRVTTLLGHSDSVYCVEFDSYKIVTGSRDRTIKVWSLKSGKLKATLRGHEGSVLCLKFDSTGFMVSGSSDRKILVWDLNKGEIQKVLTGHTGGVLDIRMDKRWIVSCSKDTVIKVWDRETLTSYCSFHGHDGPVNAVGLQDGKIVSASGDGRMMLWDIATRSLVRTFEGHTLGLACIEFKDDIICSGSNDHKIKVWSASTGECLATLSGHSGLVRALSFNPHTGRLVSGSYDQTVKLWDIKSARLIRQFQDTHQSHIFDVKFDASRIVSTSHDQKIVVLDWSQGLDTSLFL